MPRNWMTPEQVKEVRLKLGLTQTQLAKRLRMKGNGARQIRAWESGEAPITGPASLAIEYMLREKAK